jgi:pimeloyl-ACP methyl ester carboxylesterase
MVIISKYRRALNCEFRIRSSVCRKSVTAIVSSFIFSSSFFGVPPISEFAAAEHVSPIAAISRGSAQLEKWLAPFEVDFAPLISRDPVTKQERLQSFVKIRSQRELFVDYLKPQAGKPIVVLLNGLTYRTGIWDKFVEELKGNGIGILRYDPMGQGKTLAKYGKPDAAIDADEQVNDLNSLLGSLGIRRPIHLVGLSYGGAIGTKFAIAFPKMVASLILMAPFTKPLESQDQQIRLQIAQTRALYPFNPASDDELYDFFLKQTVYSNYPMAEPIVLEHPWKLEATFRLVQGIRKFNAEYVVNQLPANSVHLMVAEWDQYIEPKILETLWQQIPKRSRESRLILNYSEHKIPEAMPSFSARWVRLIVGGDKRLHGGRTWVGGTLLGYAQSGSDRISVN